MVSEVKESSDFWTIFDLFLGLFWTVLCIYCEIRPILRTLWTISCEFKAFFRRGEIPGYRHTQRNTLIHNLVVKGERSGYRQDPLIPVVHRDTYPLRQKGKSTRHANHMAGGKAQSGDKQRPPPGGQRPSPSRAPTRTSRRAGIGQGDLPHTKVTTSS